MSNISLVLVCSELTSFVRKILQREENKEVELTVNLCSGLRAMGSGRMGEDAGPETIEQKQRGWRKAAPPFRKTKNGWATRRIFKGGPPHRTHCRSAYLGCGRT